MPGSGAPVRTHGGERTRHGTRWPDTSSEGQGGGRHLSEAVSGLIKLQGRGNKEMKLRAKNKLTRAKQ